jgi:hypothetical protein
MSKLTKEQLIAQIAEAAKTRAIEASDRIEEIKLTNELTYIQSDKYLDDQVKLADDKILLAITKPLNAISDLSFTRYKEFMFGSQLNELLGAIRTVQFQKKEGHVPLNEAILTSPELEQFINIIDLHGSELPEAMGRQTYFDKLTGTIVSGTIGDAEQARDILSTICRELGLCNVSLSKVSHAHFTLLEDKAVIRANQMLEDNQLLSGEAVSASEDIVYQTA